MIPDLPEQPRVVLDACVLYPTVVRAVLLAVAGQGAFVPVWSARLLEEWGRAAARRGPVDEAQARGEIALARAAFPGAERPAAPGIEARLWLPDPNDLHVLATAIQSSADMIVTWNARDFPRATLAEEGVARLDPDAFLLALWLRDTGRVERAADSVWAEAQRIDAVQGAAADTGAGPSQSRKSLFKKARLPRLAKALGT